MLKIHFSDADYARVHVSSAPDPLWETVLGVQRLIQVDSPVFAAWRQRALREAQERIPRAALRMLSRLAPPVSYFPDFLTPAESADGLRAGLEALRATSASRLRQDIEYAATKRKLPSWAGRLAAGEPEIVGDLVDAVRRVHDVIIAPDWSEVGIHVDADRALRYRAFCAGGVHHLLESLRPVLCWEPPILSGRYPVDMDIHLNGRGLRLIPSYFNWGNPVALADPVLPPVVVYPIEHSPAWLPSQVNARQPTALAALLGRTRAAVLATLTSAATTGELATRLRISTSSASEHTGVLRGAGLVHSRREGPQVVHTVTPLGAAVLAGDLTPHAAASDLRFSVTPETS